VKQGENSIPDGWIIGFLVATRLSEKELLRASGPEVPPIPK
jgi:hypothetical protein